MNKDDSSEKRRHSWKRMIIFLRRGRFASYTRKQTSVTNKAVVGNQDGLFGNEDIPCKRKQFPASNEITHGQDKQLHSIKDKWFSKDRNCAGEEGSV